VGVDRLVNERAYTAAYPLHEIHPDELNQRQVLHYYWARWCKWFKYQPLDHIREYFGEKIALYFAWLGMKSFLFLEIPELLCILVNVASFTLHVSSPGREGRRF
uniref:Anoctamin n=1 Tax=Poecilia reticulata TaxID=8081 RepID=A0A3P9NB82_POERE